MSRIHELIESIIGRNDLVRDVYQEGNEIFFAFDAHLMSVIRREKSVNTWGKYSLYLYPMANGTPKGLAEMLEQIDPDQVMMTAFHSEDYGEQLLSKLYLTIQECEPSVKNIIDDVISKKVPGS